MITIANERLFPADIAFTELVTLNGLGEQPLTGKIVKAIDIKIGTLSLSWDVCLATVSDQLILGLDFLEAHRAVINLQNNAISIGGEVMATRIIERQPKQPETRSSFVMRAVTVPPNSRMKVALNVESPIEGDYIVEPTYTSANVLVSNALWTGDRCFVNVLNDSNRFIKLKRGYVLPMWNL